MHNNIRNDSFMHDHLLMEKSNWQIFLFVWKGNCAIFMFTYIVNKRSMFYNLSGTKITEWQEVFEVYWLIWTT